MVIAQFKEEPIIRMSLRPGAVNFDNKWQDLRGTIEAVVKLKPVKRITWNDNISYPHDSVITNSNYCIL